MEHYYVNDNTQPNGDHEVHKKDCNYLPQPQNRTSLGLHSSCYGAVADAKKKYKTANGCAYCCPACHTS